MHVYKPVQCTCVEPAELSSSSAREQSVVGLNPT